MARMSRRPNGLVHGDGYTYHGQSHRLVFPGLPWLFAGLFKLFGTDSPLADAELRHAPLVSITNREQHALDELHAAVRGARRAARKRGQRADDGPRRL